MNSINTNSKSSQKTKGDAHQTACEKSQHQKQYDEYQARQAMRTTIARGLQDANPHLVPGQSCVIAAKNIRIELKAAFKGVKFSIKSESFSGGNAIRASWTDGPTVAQVEEITGRYKAGSFDGMTDCYDYEFSYWAEAFGDAKYISSSRTVSDELAERVLTNLKNQYGTIDGEECPTLAQYRNGEVWNSPWQRQIQLAMTDAR